MEPSSTDGQAVKRSRPKRNESFLTKVGSLRDEQERVQKKTFTKWINSNLIKYEQPCTMEDLFIDIKDGLKLIMLLEVLSGEKMAKENRNVMQRVHYLSNMRTALEFLERKKVKLVNINASDIVDGKTSIVLGLCWSIILHFQITEQEDLIERALAGTSFGQKFKGSAKNALMAWAQNCVSEKYGIEIKDFGSSWRNGHAFNAMVHNIDPSLIDMDEVRNRSNSVNLESAFSIAENSLGIARLLDPEDVDVDKPDEKSIMTYVAQFLKAYPEGGEANQSDSSEKATDPSRTLLEQERRDFEIVSSFFDEADRTKPRFGQTLGRPEEEYKKYQHIVMSQKESQDPYERLLQHRKDGQLLLMDPKALDIMEEHWKQLDREMMQWRWQLDSSLPGDLGVVGKWLMAAESSLYQDWPQGDDETVSCILHERLMQHNSIFKDMEDMRNLMVQLKNNPTPGVPKEQLDDMERRMIQVYQKEPETFRKLEYLELRYRMLIYFLLTDRKLRLWTSKYGRQPTVEKLYEDYQSFVEKGQLAENFQASFSEFKQKAELYKRRELLNQPKECSAVDKFLQDSTDRWKRLLIELASSKSSIQKVLSQWTVYNENEVALRKWIQEAENMIRSPTKIPKEFFEDILEWQKRHNLLNSAGVFLVDSCQSDVSNDVNNNLSDLNRRWKILLEELSKIRKLEESESQKRKYADGLQQMVDWLDKVEEHFNRTVPCSNEMLLEYNVLLQGDLSQIETMEGELKNVCKLGQNLVKEDTHNANEILSTLKTLRDRLVKTRKDLPDGVQNLKQIIRDAGSIAKGVSELEKWIAEGEDLLEGGGAAAKQKRESPEECLRRHKAHFQETMKLKSELESKSRALKHFVNTTFPNIDTSHMEDSIQVAKKRFQNLASRADELAIENQQCKEALQNARNWLNLNSSLLERCSDSSGDRSTLERKLERIRDLQKGQEEGAAKIQNALLTCQRSSQNGGPPNQELENLEKTWQLYVGKLGASDNQLKEKIASWEVVEASQDSLGQWLRDKERSLKDGTPKSTLQEKKNQLYKLEEITQELKDKLSEVEAMRQNAHKVGDTTATNQIGAAADQLASRFHHAINNAQNLKEKCDEDVKNHVQYEKNFADAKLLLVNLKKDFSESEPSTESKKELEERKIKIEQLLAHMYEVEDGLKMALDAGEQLSASTAPDGRAKIRQELAQLKADCETVHENMSSSQRRTDTLLKEWSAVDDKQFQLNSWLCQAEKNSTGELILRNTMEEKLQQLQQYRVWLADVQSNSRKMQSLADKTHDLTSGVHARQVEDDMDALKQRFKNVQTKANEIVAQYELFVRDHQQYDTVYSEITEWLTSQGEHLTLASDVTGDPHAIQSRIERLKDISMVQQEGKTKLENLDSVMKRTCVGTADRGKTKLNDEVKEIHEEWEDFLLTLNQRRQDLENALQRWRTFEDSQDKCQNWLKKAQQDLRDIEWQSSVEEKKATVKHLQHILESCEAHKRNFDQLNDQAKILVQSSAESGQVTAAASQLVNWQTLLELQTHESLRQWESCVQDHATFEDNLCVTKQWMLDFDSRLKKCGSLQPTDDKNQIELKLDQLHSLMNQRNEGLFQLESLNSNLEKVLCSTSGSGRDKLRHDFQEVQAGWEADVALLNKCKTQLENSLAEWNLYNEESDQLDSWLQQQSAALAAEAACKPITLAEKKAQLDRINHLMNQISGRQTAVRLLIGKAPTVNNNEDASSKVVGMAKKFEKLQDDGKELARFCENSVKDHELYKVALKDFNDWVNMKQEQVSAELYSENSTDSDGVNESLTRLQMLQHEKRLAQEKLELTLERGRKACQSAPNAVASAAIKEELDTVQGAYAKLFNDAQNCEAQLADRCDKLNRFEKSLGSIKAWLDEMESCLKSASDLQCTCEQKQNQLKRHKVQHSDIVAMQVDLTNVADAGAALVGENTKFNVQLNQLTARYNSLLSLSKDMLKKLTSHVEDHEEYLRNYETAEQWLTQVNKKVDDCHHPRSAGNKYSVQAQLDTLNELSITQNQGQVLVQSAATWSNKTHNNSNAEGRECLRKEMRDLQALWDRFVSLLSETRVELENNFLSMSELDDNLEQAQQWLKEVERRQKDIENRSTSDLSEMRLQMQRARVLRQDVEKYFPAVQALVSRAKESKINDKEDCAAELQRRFQKLNTVCQEQLARCEEDVNQCQSYQQTCFAFNSWLRESREKMIACSDVYGDLPTIQNKLKMAKALAGELEEGKKKLTAVIEASDELALNSNVNSQAKLQVDLLQMKREYSEFVSTFNATEQALQNSQDSWEELQESLNRFDAWLSCGDFRNNTVLNKGSILEKKQQHETFVKNFQDLQSRQGELDAIISKGQQFLESNSNSRLSYTLTQLSNRYQTALSGCQDAVNRSEAIYSDHSILQLSCDDFQTWYWKAYQVLSQLDNAPRNQTELQRNKTSLVELQSLLDAGQEKLRIATDLSSRVLATSDLSGCQIITQQLEQMSYDFGTLKDMVTQSKLKTDMTSHLLDEFQHAHDNLDSWLTNIETKVKDDPLSMLTDLTHRKAALDHLKMLNLDIEAHKFQVEKMGEKASQLNDPSLHENADKQQRRYNRIQRSIEDQLYKLEESVNGQDEFKSAHQAAIDWIKQARLRLKRFNDLSGDSSELVERLEGLVNLRAELQHEGQAVMDPMLRFGDLIVANGLPNQEQVARDVEFSQTALKELLNEADQMERQLDSTANKWCTYSEINQHFQNWLNNAENKSKRYGTDTASTSRPLRDYQLLQDEIVQHRSELYHLQTLAADLHKAGQDNQLTSKMTLTNERYETLSAFCNEAAERLSQAMKNSKGFQDAHNDVERWIEHTTKCALACSNASGDQLTVRQNLQTIKDIQARMDEGQSKLARAMDYGERCLKCPSTENVEKIRRQLEQLRLNWAELTRQLQQCEKNLEKSSTRWKEFDDCRSRLNTLVNNVEKQLDNLGSPMAYQSLDVTEKRAHLEQVKVLKIEIEGHAFEVEQLRKLCDELHVSGANIPLVSEQTVCLTERYHRLLGRCEDRIQALSHAYLQHQTYHDALQEMERWILQTSFKLMNENSALSASFEGNQAQVDQHNETLREINEHRHVLDNLIVQGRRLADEANDNPQMTKQLKTQISSVNDSYNNLSLTAEQIKERLNDNSVKWNHLHQVLKDADEFAHNELPRWWLGKDPVTSNNVESCSRQLNEARDMQQRIGQMRQDVRSAAHRCEIFCYGSEKQGHSRTRFSSRSQFATPRLPESPSFFTPHFTNGGVDLSLDHNSTFPLVTRVNKAVEDLGDNAIRIDQRILELSQHLSLWEPLEKSKDYFREWLLQTQVAVNDLSNLPTTIQASVRTAEMEITKLEELCSEIQTKEPDLLKLREECAKLNPNGSDSDLRYLHEQYRELNLQTKRQLQQRRDFLDDYRRKKAAVDEEMESIVQKFANEQFISPLFNQDDAKDNQTSRSYGTQTPLQTNRIDSPYLKANGHQSSINGPDSPRSSGSIKDEYLTVPTSKKSLNRDRSPADVNNEVTSTPLDESEQRRNAARAQALRNLLTTVKLMKNELRKLPSNRSPNSCQPPMESIRRSNPYLAMGLSESHLHNNSPKRSISPVRSISPERNNLNTRSISPLRHATSGVALPSMLRSVDTADQMHLMHPTGANFKDEFVLASTNRSLPLPKRSASPTRRATSQADVVNSLYSSVLNRSKAHDRSPQYALTNGNTPHNHVARSISPSRDSQRVAFSERSSFEEPRTISNLYGLDANTFDKYIPTQAHWREGPLVNGTPLATSRSQPVYVPVPVPVPVAPLPSPQAPRQVFVREFNREYTPLKSEPHSSHHHHHHHHQSKEKLRKSRSTGPIKSTSTSTSTEHLNKANKKAKELHNLSQKIKSQMNSP